MHNCLRRFVRFAKNVMGVAPGATDAETAEKGIDAMAAFFRSIGMPTNLRELGVSPAEDDFRLLAKNCAIAVGGKIGSAMPLYEKDMEAIYRAAKE
jgi:alcohol dehydrogenase YqhD (iron-dependent ADH family)